ncbi:unnamed protein product [Echinostoma caproni]|uniref:Filamin-A n=1 Tax=Echinostoma caproni TaxID=27848 RepID=A0A183A8Z1_9TREM|nr:unnamed protein product [Echinostoma caproni]
MHVIIHKRKLEHQPTVRIYGPGVEKSKTSVVVGKPVEFYVEGLADAVPPSIYRTISDTNLESVLRAECHDVTGTPVPMRVYHRSDGTVVYMYTPTTTGVHTISATVANVPLQGAPFRVNVAADVQPEKVKVYGPGLNDALLNEPTHFIVDPREAFPGEQTPETIRSYPVTVRAADEHGRSVPVKVNKQPDGTYRVEYTPDPSMNEVTFTPMLGNIPTCKSPLRVTVRPPFDTRRIRIVDLNTTMAVGSTQTFHLIPGPELKLSEPPTVCFRSLFGTGSLAPESVQVETTGYAVTFCPTVVGKYQITVHLGGRDVSEPRNFDVIPSDSSYLANGHETRMFTGSRPTDSAFARTNAPETVFVVRTEMFVQVTHKNHRVTDAMPVRANPTVCCNGHGCGTPPPAAPSSVPTKGMTASGEIQTPSTSQSSAAQTTGVFHLHIQTESTTIISAESLTLYSVQEEPDAHRAETTGTIGSVSYKQPLTLDPEVKQATDLDDSNRDPAGPKLGVHPPRPYITEKEKANLIAKSRWPQASPDQSATKVFAEGPGLLQALINQTATFTIDSRNAPAAPLGVTVTGPGEATIECVDNGDGTCSVTYTPTQPGRYIVNVVYNGEAHIPGSPFFVQAFPANRPDLRTDLCLTYGLGVRSKGVFRASYVKFTVDASAIDPTGQGTVSGILCAPDNERLTCQVQNNHDGTYTCSYTPLEEGMHQVELSYEGVPLPGSPFDVLVVPGCDPNRVKAYGPGLEDGPHLTPGTKTQFLVDLTGAGQGGLGLAVEGPSEAPIECQDNRDGTCTVFYTPTEPGAYAIFVRFNDTNIPKSPFYVNVKAKVDPNQVQCYGPGLESGLLRAGWPAYFTVDTKKAGDARLQITMRNSSFQVMYTPKPGAEMRAASIQPLGTAAGKDLSQPQHYHKITYTPEAEGICQIEVKYDGRHVPGSPFAVQIRKSCEPERVKVLGPGVEGPVLASLPVTFTVDARDAGMGDLTLGLTDPKGQSVPVRVVPLSVDNESVVTNGAVPSVASLASGDVSDTGLLSCTYEPYMVGPHVIHVMFAGVEVENSPFTVQCAATGRADQCHLREGVKDVVAVGEEYKITVNTASGGKGRLTCQVVQQPVGQSAASATLLPVETEDNRDGTTSVYYTPTQLGQLAVELRYGGQLIPNGEFTQKVVTREEFEALSKPVVVYRPVEFRLPSPRGDVEIESIVVRPSGAQQHVPHTVNNDDTITITYEPVEQGMHELHVNTFSAVKSGSTRGSTVAMPLQGSPYRFYVDNVATGRVTAYGPGLSHGLTNQPAEFTIVTKEAGGGGLSLSVEGPSKAEITCKENDDGTCSVSYLPLAPGQYHISIKFMNQHISGSPFMAKITGDVLKRAQLSMGAPSDIALEALGDDIATLTACVRSVSGREEPCVLKRLPNNRLGISFTPKEVGEHLISVFQAGQHIANSPFRIRISEKEIGDPRRVRVSGPGLISGFANQPNQFTVDTRDAGYAGLSLSVEGPSKAEIECHDNHDGTCSVIYTPTEPGPYVINVKYADMHVPNSPFCVDIGGEATTRVTERITRRREASSVTNVGSRCELSLRVTDTNLRDMTASVTSPSGQKTACEIVPVDADHYNIKFVPQEMGEHLVTVKHRGINIAGSPFQFTVGPITDGVANKVRAIGPGLQQGLTHENNEFTIYTREAGAGTLAIAIEGPSKADIECEERRDGSSLVSYRVSLPGVYTCSLKFNDEHIPFSPFRIYVTDSSQMGRIASYTLQSQYASTREVTSMDDVPSQVGRPVAFTIHHEESSGEVLKAKVHAPSGSVEDAIVQPIDQDQFAVRFVPRESGPHLVHVHAVPVEFADQPDLPLGPGSPYRPIQGSPFRLVISHHAADPGMVHASGEGLRRGKVDMKNTFFVNTANAGSGVLNVTVDGPSKVSLTTQEQDEGYAFTYVPPVPGIYEITIKYGGNFHIVGSPFKAEITGTPKLTSGSSRVSEHQSHVVLETVSKTTTTSAYGSAEMSDRRTGTHADRVRCQGHGLKHADIETVNYFNVDASDAGSEVLLVGICGPTRPFEEVKVKHLGNNQYSVSYRVNESGRHWLLVKWGDQHVPGSPFVVDVP